MSSTTGTNPPDDIPHQLLGVQHALSLLHPSPKVRPDDYATCLYSLTTHSSAVTCVRFSPNGKFLASASTDLIVQIFSLEGLPVCRLFGLHSLPINTIQWSPCSQYIAMGSQDGFVSLWSVSEQLPLFFLKGHTMPIQSLSFSPTGSLLAATGQDNTITFFDIHTGSLIRQLDAHNDTVFDVQFSADGTILVSCSNDGTIRYWDVASGFCLCTIQQGETRVSYGKLQLLPHSASFCIASCLDSCVRVYDAISGTCVSLLTGNVNTQFPIDISLLKRPNRVISKLFEQKLEAYVIKTHQFMKERGTRPEKSVFLSSMHKTTLNNLQIRRRKFLASIISKFSDEDQLDEQILRDVSEISEAWGSLLGPDSQIDFDTMVDFYKEQTVGGIYQTFLTMLESNESEHAQDIAPINDGYIPSQQSINLLTQNGQDDPTVFFEALLAKERQNDDPSQSKPFGVISSSVVPPTTGLDSPSTTQTTTTTTSTTTPLVASSENVALSHLNQPSILRNSSTLHNNIRITAEHTTQDGFLPVNHSCFAPEYTPEWKLPNAPPDFLAELARHVGQAFSSPAVTMVVSGSEDGGVCFWNAKTLQEQYNSPPSQHSSTLPEYLPVEQGGLLFKIKSHLDVVSTIHCHPFLPLVAVGGMDRDPKVKVWHILYDQ